MRFPGRRSYPPLASEVVARAPESTNLEDSYALCRRLTKDLSSTSYWTMQMMPKVKQHHVQAIFAFVRYADDVIQGAAGASPNERAHELNAFTDRLFDDLQLGRSDDAVLKAVVHTAKSFDIEVHCFRRYLDAKRMDLRRSTFETWQDLLAYLDGWATIVGDMVFPILEPRDSAVACRHGRDLGTALHFTSLLRDLGDHLLGNRLYLPDEDVRRYHVDPFQESVRVRQGARVSPGWASLLRFEIGRCRNLYVSGDIGAGLLPDRSARAIRTTRIIHSRVLELIEQHGFDVFTAKPAVPAWQKAALAAQAMR
jgi:15-cis-phytoene synthase